MKKIKICEATDNQLNWLVARCLGHRPALFILEQTVKLAVEHHYSTDWSLGGPIIASNDMEFDFECLDAFGSYIECGPRDVYRAKFQSEDANMPTCAKGSTHLVAAIRAFVVSKLGYEAEVPEGV